MRLPRAQVPLKPTLRSPGPGDKSPAGTEGETSASASPNRDLGPVCTLCFETCETLRFQIRDLLLFEKGGPAQVGDERIYGVQDGDVERTREDGKTSSVHFLHFPLTDAQKAVFRSPGVQVLVGCDHEAYVHMTGLTPATRAELARDFS